MTRFALARALICFLIGHGDCIRESWSFHGERGWYAPRCLRCGKYLV